MPRLYLTILLVFFVLVLRASARTNAIAEDLDEILRAYPALGYSPASLPIRRPWNSSVSSVCDFPADMPTTGILCDSGLIFGLLIDEAWSLPFHHITLQSRGGLSASLRTFEMRLAEDSHDGLVAALFGSSTALTNIRLDYVTPANLQLILQSSSSIENLTIVCPDCDKDDIASLNWGEQRASLKLLNLTLPAVTDLSLQLFDGLEHLTHLYLTAPLAKLGAVNIAEIFSTLDVLHLEADTSDGSLPTSASIKNFYLSRLAVPVPFNLNFGSWSNLVNFSCIRCQAETLSLPAGLQILLFEPVRQEYSNMIGALPNGLEYYTVRNFRWLESQPLYLRGPTNLVSVTFINVYQDADWPILPQSVRIFTAVNCAMQAGYYNTAINLTHLTLINTTDNEPSYSIWRNLFKIHYEGISVDFDSMELEKAVEVAFVDCGLTSIPENVLTTPDLLYLNLSHNTIITDIEDLDWSQWPNLITLDLSFNQINSGIGTLPSILHYLESLNLSNNQLTGAISSQNFDFELSVLDARNNKLEALEIRSCFSASLITEIRLDGNPMVQIPPDDSMVNCFSALQIFTLSDLSSSNGDPAVITSFWAVHPSLYRFESARNPSGLMPSEITAPFLRIIDLSQTHMAPDSSLPNLHPEYPRIFRANFSECNLKGAVPNSFVHWAFEKLDLSRNSLNGCFNRFLLSYGSQAVMTDLCISTNNFDGPLPDLTNFRRLELFDASTNRFNVCLSQPFYNTNYSASLSCNIRNQGISSVCGCPSLYATSSSPCDPNACETVQSFMGTYSCFYAPFSPTGPTSPSLSPTSILKPCPGLPPSISFTCNNVTGIWYIIGSVTTPTFLLPPQSNVEITGDLNVTTLTFTYGSSLSISGCVYLSGNVSLVISEGDIESFSKTKLITLLTANTGNQTCTNSSDLTKAVLHIKTPNLKCKRLVTENKSRHDTLAVAFSIDSSRCNLWWIILVAVLGGVILLVLIAVLIVTLVPSAKAAVRPFWVRTKRRDNGQSANVS